MKCRVFEYRQRMVDFPCQKKKGGPAKKRANNKNESADADEGYRLWFPSKSSKSVQFFSMSATGLLKMRLRGEVGHAWSRHCL